MLSEGDKLNSTYVTNRSRRLMHDWNFNPLADRYSMSSDHDDMWRPGGSVDEVCESAGIDPKSIAAGVVAFAKDHAKRMTELGGMLDKAKG